MIDLILKAIHLSIKRWIAFSLFFRKS